MKTLKVLGMGDCENGVTTVSFSALNSGDYVVAVDASKEFTIAVWEWDILTFDWSGAFIFRLW